MNKVLQIEDYIKKIDLLDSFIPKILDTDNEVDLVDYLLLELNEEGSESLSYNDKRNLLRAKLNTLPPNILGQKNINKLDSLLQLELKNKNITDFENLKNSGNKINKTEVIIWKGDITTLKIDAIVNAANNQLLGCFQPLHKCIDNVIHSAAGVRLRDDCFIIMEEQGFEEPTGICKITRAYNLPSKYVFHTVGPIVRGKVIPQNESDLANVYINCLNLCKQFKNIRSLSFCCVSTGVFGYPQTEAATVAYNTVKKWLIDNPGFLDVIVFNVFSNDDESIYKSIAGGNYES